MASLAGNNFVREKEKYSLAEKKALGELISKYKEKYDKEKEELQGKTRYDKKRKRHVQIKPQQQGFLAAAVREFYPDLSEVKHNDTNLVKALKFAKRCHEKYLSNDFEVEQPSAKKFRESGAGRKFKAPEVREAMFEKKYAKRSKIIDLAVLPPCEAVLFLHTARAILVAKIWRSSLVSTHDPPSITEQGWNADGSPIWVTNTFPDDICKILCETSLDSIDEDLEEDEEYSDDE